MLRPAQLASFRAAFVIALLALGLAGFTGSSWGFLGSVDRLNDVEARGRRLELFASHRPIRGDEYSVDLPLGRAQQLSSPTYPLVNLNLGLGQMQRNPFDAPVLDWGIAFRPYVWPLLAGNRWSLGVRWFWRDALIAIGLFAWLGVLRPRASERAASPVPTLCALAVMFSGYLVWWRGHAIAQIIGLAGLVVASVDRGARANGPAARAGWLAATAYLSACAFFQFYAPVWAPVLWVVCACAIDVHLRARGPAAARVTGAALAIGAVAAGVALSIAYYAPYLALVADTLYPGRRVALGGDVPLHRLAEMAWPSLTGVARMRGYDEYVGVLPGWNVCEAAAVEVMPAFVLVPLALVSRRVRAAAARALRANPALTAAIAVLALWMFVTVPRSIGWVTLLRWSQGGRTWVAFGVACALLLAAVLAELDDATPPERSVRIALPELVIAVAALALCGWWARGWVRPEGRGFLAPIVLSAALLAAAAAALRTRRSGTWFAAAWVVPLLLANGRVNPLLRSRDLFVEGPGHAVVAGALRETPGRLLDYATHSGAALAGYGWPVLAAVDTAPEPSLWRFLEPDSPGLGPEVWNRYAHVRFVIAPEPTRVLAADAIEVQVSPCSPRLAALGVNHLLTGPEVTLPPACAGQFRARPAGELVLWTRVAPVRGYGFARGPLPASATSFDWAAGETGARVVPARDGIAVELPSGAPSHVAVPLNLAVLDDVACTGATATRLDTHLVVSSGGAGGGRCFARYLGTLGALRRLARGAHPETSS